MTSGLTPGMSVGVQVNMSIFFFSAACMISASAASVVVPTAMLCSSSRRGTHLSSSLAYSLSSVAWGSRSTNAMVGSTDIGRTFLGEQSFREDFLNRTGEVSFLKGSTQRLLT